MAGLLVYCGCAIAPCVHRLALAGQGMQRQLLAGTLSDRLRGLGQGLL